MRTLEYRSAKLQGVYMYMYTQLVTYADTEPTTTAVHKINYYTYIGMP